MYIVHLTNFGYNIYEGWDSNKAIEKAVRCGFECTVTHGSVTLAYSPISGWKTLQK